MSNNKNLSELLEVNANILSEKCAKFSRLLLESKLLSTKTTEDVVEFLQTYFSKGEIEFLAIGFLTDKTNALISSMENLEEIIDSAKKRHGVPDDIAETLKTILNVKKGSSHVEEDNV